MSDQEIERKILIVSYISLTKLMFIALLEP